ncbi:aspartate carbamoyltransferase catalytic subunit [Salinisphaera sp.]|mgnify:CR=1 FL=1|uniref:aspartate carbamoyltransferase catalytic subunit n=1 Tax=Salinisphaera sp. TaxID=1914330 RepID=UPI000C4764EB|nr:aspartate carbamoyltransferase catalytic subunit [Salinisphaera sp.]MAS08499.1 aspartate carbamoyltransferase catalytic subunit [Salinisphaera sp.]|tara:strand:- start:1387 stop:2361 length:975 start_codon:yes stop_codon:yes gene_type:complete
MHDIQLDAAGRLRHLITTEGLPAELITRILDTAESFVPEIGAPAKKVPLLRGRAVFNLFFENSTRTRTTFELAAKRLSADVINMDVATSSRTKGEDDLDTLFTLQAMGADVFVIRHPDNGAAARFAANAAPGVAIINAGDGSNAHPTQALLDVFTIRRHRPDFANLSVAIVGDIAHSRVAHSTIHALKTLGATDIRLVGPAAFLPADPSALGVTATTDIAAGLADCDIVMGLRIQRERIAGDVIGDIADYHRDFGLTEANLAHARPDALIMHPGPINRGVEITPEVAYSRQSLILEQVTNGIGIRMAVMAMIAGHRGAEPARPA